MLLVAVPASYALSRYNFFGRRVILSSVSSVQMFPVVVILTTLYGFYNSWRMLDTYRGLILADTTFALPLAITLMKSFFDTLSKSLDEAARIDGASRMRCCCISCFRWWFPDWSRWASTPSSTHGTTI